MAIENFLINPPKRIKRSIRRHKPYGGKFTWPFKSKKTGKFVKSYAAMYKNPIGETLVTIGANPMRRLRRRSNPGNPWFGDSSGHRIAALMRWGKIKRGRVNRHRKRRRGVKRAVRRVKSVVRRVKRVVRRRKSVHVKHRRRAGSAMRLRRKLARHSMWVDKYGEMLSHPRRKKYQYKGKGVKFYMRRTKRHKSRKANSWFKQPRRHRKAAKKGWRIGHMVPFSHSTRSRRRRIRHSNAPGYMRRRRHNVRHRRNPAIMAEFGKFTSGMMNVREWGPLAITGGLSAITGSIAPSMLGVTNPYMRLGIQAAVAIGGGIVVERVVSKAHGQAWMIVGVAMVGYQLLKQYVVLPYFPQFAVGLGGDMEGDGMGAYNQYYDNNDVSQQVGAFTDENIGAFPGSQGETYVGVEGDGMGGDGMGAYPYDGNGGY